MAQPFTHIIRPGTIDTGDSNRPRASIFCKIEFKASGELSISGVEGPTRNGNCIGACGQIVMHLSEPGALDTFLPAPGWNVDGFKRFLSIWDRWHLNHMNAATPEMRAAGWIEKAATPIYIWRFTMSAESLACKKAAEYAAGEALKAGQTFTPTPAQTAAAVMPYQVDIYSLDGDAAPETPDGYERRRSIHSGGAELPERKTLGWVKPSEHPEGLLTRAMDGDPRGYGSAWYREDVPEDVLAELQALPPADMQPAWV